MKKFLFSLTILTTLGAALLYAGPEQIPSAGKEMKQVMPVAPACPNWTGFYVGGFGGYKHGDIDTDFHPEQNNFFTDEFEDFIERSRDLDADGAELGGLIGFNYQWHNWVFGAEAAGGYLWLRDSEQADLLFLDVGPFTESVSFKTHYLFTFGPRIGYTFCRWMPYVTGGLAVGDLEYDHVVRTIGLGDDFVGSGSKTETNAGWFVGGGLEYALTNHWRIRGQYEYVDLGSVDFSNRILNNQVLIDVRGENHASLREHNASFAIIYGF